MAAGTAVVNMSTTTVMGFGLLCILIYPLLSGRRGEIVTREDKQKEESGGSQNTDNQNTNTTSGHINLSMELRSTESGVR